MPKPGFSGYVPPGDAQVVQVKTHMSERVPLAERVRSIKLHRAAAMTPDPRTAGPAPGASVFLPKRHVGSTTYSDATNATYVRSANDVPPRATEHSIIGDSTASPARISTKFNGTTVAREATGTYAEAEDASFFSRVRQTERQDDDARHSLEDPKTRSGAAKNLRCTAIQTKREQNPEFAPKPQRFTPVPRVRPNAMPQSGSSLVKFNHVTPQSTAAHDFRRPVEVVEESQSVLRDKSRTRLASDRALVECASAKDLFAGTSKSREEIASGFMGHVPAHPSNLHRVRGEKEMLRPFSKTFVTVTAPSSNSMAAVIRAKHLNEGVKQPAVTSAEYYQRLSAEAGDERRMNRVEQGRKNAVRNFFTAGVGDQDNVVADQFCTRFRPLEGAMKHGNPRNQGWISEQELRRSNQIV